MTDIRPQIQIKTQLTQCAEASDFTAAAYELLNIIGYKSDRIPPRSKSPSELLDNAKDTQTKQNFIQAAQSAHIIFQIDDSDTGMLKLDTGDQINSLIFVAVELKAGNYARGKFAEFTREINKNFLAPVVVLFRVQNQTDSHNITLAFVGRRPSKTDQNRDVLGKVSLLRAIDCHNPHRAHLEILNQLALSERQEWMNNNNQKGVAGLCQAWLDALNVDALNQSFYNKMSKWLEDARDTIKFPPNFPDQREDWVIRLITRLLFIWFIKEKGLVHQNLFIWEQIKNFLKPQPKNDSYYRVVLQNLFFATLNTPIEDRKLSKGGNDAHRNFFLYRYENEIADGRAPELIELFKRTPFINGGLFVCLDDYDSPTSAKNAGRDDGGKRIDYFSDSSGKAISLPNHLFFGANGLITIFNRYKFTVEESTPIEQEVALDPELLGQVFENLLAVYNLAADNPDKPETLAADNPDKPETLAADNPDKPETRATARKQTGSYYTPRKIVDYMVGESLIAYLAQKTQPDDGDTKFWKQSLGYLLDYADGATEAGDLFNSDTEKQNIVRAISQLRILDPAVGSGAFPMGALNRLNLALTRLDPDNTIWQKLQKQRAQTAASAVFEKTDPKAARAAQLKDINETFERYSSGFGRKLFLIQNSIFGVDNQTVACLIAKLRFFISLAIEQQANPDPKDNYGIKPLPNLETRIVAADTLITINPPNRKLVSQSVTKLVEQLKHNSERHFNASTRPEKLKCQRDDEKLRNELADALKDELGSGNADKIADWVRFNQNAAAEWFEPEYMFGITTGFDIVIGNPPYVQLQKDGGRLGNKYKSENFDSFARTGDVYMLFYERGLNLCRENGALMFITSNSWLRANYGANLRGVLARHNPRCLVNMGDNVFDKVSVSTNILHVEKRPNRRELKAADVVRTGEFPPPQWHNIAPKDKNAWLIISAAEENLRAKIQKTGTPLRDWATNTYRGITTGYNKAFIIDTETKNRLCAADPASAKIIKPTIHGKNIARYSYQSANEWIIATSGDWNLSIDDYPAIKAHLQSFGSRLEQSGEPGCRAKSSYKWFETQRPFKYYAEFEKEKLIWPRVTMRGRFAYDNQNLYPLDSGWAMTGADLKYLLAVLNSRLISWYMLGVAPNTGDSVLMWLGTYVEKLPIPQIPKSQQRPFIQLAEKITAAKAANPHADTTADEHQLDNLVYDLYNLTPAETHLIHPQKPVN